MYKSTVHMPWTKPNINSKDQQTRIQVCTNLTKEADIYMYIHVSKFPTSQLVKTYLYKISIHRTTSRLTISRLIKRTCNRQWYVLITKLRLAYYKCSLTAILLIMMKWGRDHTRALHDALSCLHVTNLAANVISQAKLSRDQILHRIMEDKVIITLIPHYTP